MWQQSRLRRLWLLKHTTGVQLYMRTNLSASVNQVHVDIAKYGTNYFRKTVIQESPFCFRLLPEGFDSNSTSRVVAKD